MRQTLTGPETPAPPSGAKGVVIVKGRYIPGPYRVEVHALPQAFDVAVNGRSVRQLPVASAQANALPTMPASGQFESLENLSRYIMLVYYPEALRRSSRPEARARVVEFLKKQSAVESVVDENDKYLKIQFKGYVMPQRLFVMNYDFDAGQIEDMGDVPPPSADEVAARASTVAQGLLKRLESGHVLVAGSAAEVEFSAPGLVAHFEQVVELAVSLPIEKSECLFAEVVEDRALARETALNLGPDLGALKTALRSEAASASESKR